MTTRMRNRRQAEESASVTAWWNGAVIYHIYPRSFCDTTGDGVGDLPGVLSRLPYLRWLGVDAIWLSPFYDSPGVDFGYDVADHTAVDPRMGTLAGTDALIDQAHRMGIRVLLDFEATNTSSRHPWFVESRSSRRSAKRDWYIWADPAADGGPPNNWLSIFGGPAWTWDHHTGQYYLHTFLPEIPDLNWRNPAVEAAMLDILRFWMDYAIDGFRIDSAEHLLKDPLLRDNPPATPVTIGYPKNLGVYDTQRHLHDRGHPDLHPLYRRIRHVLDTYRPGRPCVAIAEIVPEPGVGLGRWASFYGQVLDEIHMPMDLTLAALPWDAGAFRAAIDAAEAAIPRGGGHAVALGSHDEHRVASRYGPARAGALLAILLTLRGTPVLYYGDELGLPNSPVPRGQERDPWGRRNPAFNRDPGRTPMPWHPDGPSAGFTDSDHPWLPLAPDAGRLSVAVQRADPHSTLLLARRLLALRRRCPALRYGGYRSVDLGDDVLAYERRCDGQAALAIVNFAAAERRVPLPAGRWRVVTRTAAGGKRQSGSLEVAADEAVVLVD